MRVLYGNADIFGENQVILSFIMKPFTQKVFYQFNKTICTHTEEVRPFFDLLDRVSTVIKSNIWLNSNLSNPMVHINLILTLSDGFFIKRTFKRQIFYYSYESFTKDFGIVHIGNKLIKSYSITNYFNVPVMFIFDKPKKSKYYNIWCIDKVILQPSQQTKVDICFELHGQASVSPEIMVISNVSYPFYYKFTMNIVPPSLMFTNTKKEHVTSIEFKNGLDKLFSSQKWSKCIIIDNIGNEQINQINMKLTEQSFLTYRMKDTKILPKNREEMCFDFYLWLYTNETDNSGVQFSIVTNGFEYILPIKIELNESTIRHIYSAIESSADLIAYVCLFTPVICLIFKLILYIAFILEKKSKFDKLNRAIKHYSVANFRQKFTQKDEEEKHIFNPYSYTKNRLDKPASGTACSNMEKVLMK